MSKNGNDKKNEQLGMNHATAAGQLRKLILFKLVQEAGKDICFHCGKRIDSVDNFSIEHKVPWLDSNKPKELFFNLDNIAFSHLGCNSGAFERSKVFCIRGHPLSGDNLYSSSDGSRQCKTCRNSRNREARKNKRLQYPNW